MLEALGVEPGVEAVYRALLGRPTTTASDLAEVLHRPASDIEAQLATLVATGLALSSGDEAYIAAPPAVALGALITERRDGLRLAEQALGSLAEEYRAAVAGRSINELIEVVTGIDQVRHRYQQVQAAATTELRMFVTAPFVAVPPGENTAETAAADRGIRIRCLLERAVLDELDAPDEVVDSLQRGLELRVVDELPLKLVLADDDLALVPLAVAPGGEPGAVLLQRSGLLAALDALFESVWRRAYPLELAGSGDAVLLADDLASDAPTELDRQILGLLLAGLTDQVVAAQLGLSLRTVQRRLRHLQDLAGVKSRMQLGWFAARNDWA
ncbi:helix-turn-helix domain-containing protein [Nocardioides sp.]|uniref:helix-turn-helix domain-containing protein n=1 Tax=Nocardioides sp. TaxID=35761 RepID=UPI002ED2F39E